MFKRILYFIIQCVWGLPQTLAGFILFLVNITKKHYFYHGSIVTEWPSSSSVSLGLFVFVTSRPIYAKRMEKRLGSREASRALLVHEYGHTVQSLALGPLYLPLIGIPSLVWATSPKQRAKRDRGLPYSAFWTERSANRLGEKVTKEPSLQDVVL